MQWCVTVTSIFCNLDQFFLHAFVSKWLMGTTTSDTAPVLSWTAAAVSCQGSRAPSKYFRWKALSCFRRWRAQIVISSDNIIERITADTDLCWAGHLYSVTNHSVVSTDFREWCHLLIDYFPRKPRFHYAVRSAMGIDFSWKEKKKKRRMKSQRKRVSNCA